MLEFLFTNPALFVVWTAALLVAITVHEFAHAFAADRLGDPTPRIQGRLTLNPLAHLDPIGTIMLLLVRIGWGKPVVFDPYNLQNPKRDTAIISFAGPLSNLLVAGVLALILRLVQSPLSGVYFLTIIIPPFIFLNVVLAIFNLLPIHPLDGGKILVGLLPAEDSRHVDLFLRRYGVIILILMIFPIFGPVSPVSLLISPVINTLVNFLVPGAPMI